MAEVKKYPIVEIIWQDATSHQGWHDIDELAEDFECMNVRSVGYLIKKDRKFVKIVMGITEDDQTNMVMVIPAKWVQSIKVLRKA